MYIHLNLDGVIVDATALEKYVAVNNGTKVLTHDLSKAVGVISSKESVSPLTHTELAPGWYSVAKLIPVAELPEDYAPNKYRYIEGSIVPYDGIAPDNNTELTIKSNDNSTELAECRTAIEELYEMMEG